MQGSLTAGDDTVPTPLLGRIGHIDALRAFAALSVVLAHVVGPHLPGPLRYLFTGHPAVIAFFVISGFCIHRPYVERSFCLRAFWVARLVRILPPTLVAMLLARALDIPGFNFVDGYILWSVVCEMWYYGLYPLFRLAARVVRWEGLVVVGTVAWLVVILIVEHPAFGNANAYGPLLNWVVALPSWLLGCALADRSGFAQPVLPIFCWRLTVALVASVLYWATLNTAVGFYITMNPFALLVTFWIAAEIGAAHEKGGVFERIGRWSFSIYLFHAVAWIGLTRLGISQLWLLVPLILAGSYGFARLIEFPSHALARRAFKILSPTGVPGVRRPDGPTPTVTLRR